MFKTIDSHKKHIQYCIIREADRDSETFKAMFGGYVNATNPNLNTVVCDTALSRGLNQIKCKFRIKCFHKILFHKFASE